MEKIWKTISSLKLTVILLAFSVVLVFVGTVAQADEGLYNAQERYFKHWFVPWFSFFGSKVPIPLPGGYLLGTALLINLLAAHFTRFKWGWKKSGIFLTHVGIIMLLVGQLATDLFSRETQLRFAEGEKKFYSESSMAYELAVVSDVDADNEEAVVVPLSLLKSGGEIKHEKLPFTLRIKELWNNSNFEFRAPMMATNAPLTTNGVAQRFDFVSEPLTKKMDEKNVPTALVEVVSDNVNHGLWVLPGWSSDGGLIGGVHFSYTKKFGPQIADSVVRALSPPQILEFGDKKYSLALRPVRNYEPFGMTLLKTTHAVYPGTEIPKDFRSRVLIENPATQEKREVDIFMNNPLRYSGLTFFQSQMGKDELDRNRGTSVLQVVRNPSWLTPYVGCLVVGLGLTVQFMIHLVAFVSKRRTA
ncbi:MAG TPA: cytochrome c biogenesis protein ResB [Verrucomicrobiae bacterium]